MDTFRTIRVKIETATKFRKFSRKFFKTHSEALQTMLDFFFYNEISPKESFGPTGRTLGNLIKKRFNAMAAMMKEMETHGVLPTKAMMELLFEHSPRKKRGQAPLPMERRKADPEKDIFFKKVEEAIAIEKENTYLKRDLRQKKVEFIALLDKVQLVKRSFGKPRLQLDMAPEDLEKLKIKLEKELDRDSIIE
ncbi:BfmA/BtgA family mobilization protein [Pseudozobellia sp. WGM2]|uniref:BfmA/BtgA family mobilization protein n=1 Tax=Pseudozobellia sp. WGM2 TaxID=2787625 RepID=UPI001FD7C228|nr:BfmA/BtgA family mobilization protein [Pseudozobellia sp. WGM2]